MALGWLSRTGNINRLGEVVAMNSAWERLVLVSRSVPTNGDDTEDIPSPRRASPAAPAAATSGPGVFIFEPDEKFKNQDLPASTLPPPRLSAIGPEDFRSTERSLELFRQAVKCGLMPNGSEHSRLLWLAAIERARTVPAKNPAGVFLHVVKNRKWEFLSEGHFEAANRRLKGYLWGGSGIPLLVPVKALPGPTTGPPRRALSRDATLVQVVRNELARRGLRGDPYQSLRAHAGFTRERYETALAELENRTPVAANAV